MNLLILLFSVRYATAQPNFTTRPSTSPAHQAGDGDIAPARSRSLYEMLRSSGLQRPAARLAVSEMTVSICAAARYRYLFMGPVDADLSENSRDKALRPAVGILSNDFKAPLPARLQ